MGCPAGRSVGLPNKVVYRELTAPINVPMTSSDEREEGGLVYNGLTICYTANTGTAPGIYG